MEYLKDLADVINVLENYYDHPASVEEDHNEKPICLLYNGDPVDIDEQIHYCLKQIEDRARRLESCKRGIESIQRYRELDLKYPTNQED